MQTSSSQVTYPDGDRTMCPNANCRRMRGNLPPVMFAVPPIWSDDTRGRVRLPWLYTLLFGPAGCCSGARDSTCVVVYACIRLVFCITRKPYSIARTRRLLLSHNRSLSSNILYAFRFVCAAVWEWWHVQQGFLKSVELSARCLATFTLETGCMGFWVCRVDAQSPEGVGSIVSYGQQVCAAGTI